MDVKVENNPAGTKGFSFLEFATSEPNSLKTLLTQLGFTHIANHRKKTIELWQQNNISFLLNLDVRGYANSFQTLHKGGACGMGFLIKDLSTCHSRCIEKGAKEIEKSEHDWHNDSFKVIKGIADTRLYLTELDNILDSQLFTVIPGRLEEMKLNSSKLMFLDHLTHNVYRGSMDKWAKFYEDLFNFRQIRYFDIEGKLTGLISRAMTSPCLNIKIPINESVDDKSQIEEFLHEFNGEGIQHIALASENIYETVEKLKKSGINFMRTPDSYYQNVRKRLPYNDEPLEDLHKNNILVDGAPTKNGGYLLQIFTETVIGPVFFEIIQRKGDDGFGEGNFQALFDSIEQDQIERGVL
jgi:4-hydroxyphenylpyruvate dioxygenase